MKRYCLSIFRTPEMHDKGDWARYEDADREIRLEKGWTEAEKAVAAFYKGEAEKYRKAHGEVLLLAEKQQRTAQSYKGKYLLSRAACSAVLALSIAAHFLIN